MIKVCGFYWENSVRKDLKGVKTTTSHFQHSLSPGHESNPGFLNANPFRNHRNITHSDGTESLNKAREESGTGSLGLSPHEPKLRHGPLTIHHSESCFPSLSSMLTYRTMKL